MHIDYGSIQSASTRKWMRRAHRILSDDGLAAVPVAACYLEALRMRSGFRAARVAERQRRWWQKFNDAMRKAYEPHIASMVYDCRGFLAALLDPRGPDAPA